MEIPGTQIKFEKMFDDESRCEDLIISIKYKDGFKCRVCNHTEYWKQSRKRLCCKQCRTKESILKDTLFEQTNKPLVLWFRVIWTMVVQKNGVSALSLQRMMGFGSYQTAWSWLHKLRSLTVMPERNKLSGTIEVDETLLGGKHAGKRGRGALGKILVAIAVEIQEKRTGRARLCVIKDASLESLKNFVDDNIEKGSELVTDGWKPYKSIKGYKQTVVKGSEELEKNTVLPNVHRIASLLKRWQLGTHQTYLTSNKSQNYLDEFTFRYNRRTSKSRGLLFERLITQAVHNKKNQNSIAGK